MMKKIRDRTRTSMLWDDFRFDEIAEA